MDGFETTRRIKAHCALQQIPVIFMTGLSETQPIVEGLSEDAAMLSTPVRI